MKFKAFTVVLLGVCFVLLGVLSGVIPVREADMPAAAILPRTADRDAAPSPSGAVPAVTLPAAAVLAPTAAPSAAPTEEPAVSSAPEAVTAAPSHAHTGGVGTPPAPEPTEAPTAAPTPTAESARPAVEDPWSPDVEVVSTTITSSSPLRNETGYTVDGSALMAKPPAVTLPESGYQILIIHTHGTEAYTPDGEDQYQAVGDFRTTDTACNVVRVGRALADALESYGLRVLVDEGLYDYPSYNGSYARSAEAIQSYLAEDPGIGMVIDLHRDALGDDEMIYKTVSDQVQPDAAQIMFVMGSDTNLSYPHWEDNLSLAMSLQGLVEQRYPHLMRPTILCQYRYNQQMTAGSLLMEVGTTGNTLQEAITAVELFADAVGPALAARVGA